MLDQALNRAQGRTFLRTDKQPAGWAVSKGLTDYATAVKAMEARATAIANGEASEMVWLLEHPPIYTAGVSARASDLLDPDRFPVHRTARGGQFTYHGPGQRVAYVMLDLSKRQRDVHAFVAALETWVIGALDVFKVCGELRPGRVGVWVERRAAGLANREDKIAAIGVKLRKWVSFHGISLNIDPNLSHFNGIVPCGIVDHGVTSLVDLGLSVGMAEVDTALRTSFECVFGLTADEAPPL